MLTPLLGEWMGQIGRFISAVLASAVLAHVVDDSEQAVEVVVKRSRQLDGRHHLVLSLGKRVT